METNVMKRCMMRASSLGTKIFRNNVGYFKTLDLMRTVFCGLCKGSSDTIGFRPVLITPDMVGRTIAVFVAIEIKEGDSKPTDDQRNFISVVKKSGGWAGVAYEPDDVDRILSLLPGV